MPYVMVPVPEEHVEDVMQFILRSMERASMEPWDGESLAEAYHAADEITRSLLAFVARAEAKGKELDIVAAANQIQMTPRDVNGILNELQTYVRSVNRPPLLVAHTVSERLPNGRTTDKRVLSIEPDVAKLVREAERTEVEQMRAALEPTPGGGG